MNKKHLLLLIGLGIVLAILAVLVSRKQNAPYRQTAREGAKLLSGFDVNAVASIRIRNGSNTVTLAKQADVWVVGERGNYPANFSSISDLMRQFWDLKISRSVQTGSSRLPSLGLDGPDKTSTLLEMRSSDGKLLHSIVLGTNSLDGARGWPRGRYVMLENDPKTVCLVADSLRSVDPLSAHWLSKDFFKVEKLKAIAVVTPQGAHNWSLTRDSESAEWKLTDAAADEKLDSGKTSSLGGLLSSPSFEDVLTDTIKLDNPVAATLETFDGFTYAVKLAGNTDDTWYLQLAVSAKLPLERVAEKEEKPEDKARLDKEFQDNRRKLEEKLKTEQSYARWTYVVSKWTVETLLKNRKDFLVEKPAETATAPSAASDATSTPSK